MYNSMVSLAKLQFPVYWPIATVLLVLRHNMLLVLGSRLISASVQVGGGGLELMGI
jgi:hypothetical protein